VTVFDAPFGRQAIQAKFPVNGARSSLLFSISIIDTFHHEPQTDYDHQEYHDSCQEPSEHAGIVLMAEIKHKLPKPGHLGLGHALCKHRVLLPGLLLWALARIIHDDSS
jgi:hypothetical protein